jgi:hypothetical protein
MARKNPTPDTTAETPEIAIPFAGLASTSVSDDPRKLPTV